MVSLFSHSAGYFWQSWVIGFTGGFESGQIVILYTLSYCIVFLLLPCWVWHTAILCCTLAFITVALSHCHIALCSNCYYGDFITLSYCIVFSLLPCFTVFGELQCIYFYHRLSWLKLPFGIDVRELKYTPMDQVVIDWGIYCIWWIAMYVFSLQVVMADIASWHCSFGFILVAVVYC